VHFAENYFVKVLILWFIQVSTLEIIFCAFCRKLFREGTYLVVYPG